MIHKERNEKSALIRAWTLKAISRVTSVTCTSVVTNWVLTSSLWVAFVGAFVVSGMKISSETAKSWSFVSQRWSGKIWTWRSALFQPMTVDATHCGWSIFRKHFLTHKLRECLLRRKSEEHKQNEYEWHLCRRIGFRFMETFCLSWLFSEYLLLIIQVKVVKTYPRTVH